MMELDFKRVDKLFISVTRDHIVEMMGIGDYKAGVSDTMSKMQSQIDELTESLREEVNSRERLEEQTNLLIEKIDRQS